MTEGLMALCMLGFMMFAVQHIGLWQQKSLEMLSRTSYISFFVTKGGPAPLTFDQAVIKNDNLKQVQLDARSVQGPPNRLTVITKQLGMSHDHVEVSQSGFFSQNKKHNVFEIKRTSYVQAGVGYGASDQQVHQKIAQSDALWRQASLRSRAIAKRIDTATAVVDHPWLRTRMSTDWFSKWQSAVPEKYILKSRP